MKERLAEVERIARAERLLGDYMGRTFAKIVGDIGEACDITIQRLRVQVRGDGTTGPEPPLHFVITAAKVHNSAPDDVGQPTAIESAKLLVPID